MDSATTELTFEDAIDLLLTLLPSDATNILLHAGPNDLDRYQAVFADKLKELIPIDDDDLMALCGADDSYTAEETLIRTAWLRARDKRVH
jgi:hypothetical protein